MRNAVAELYSLGLIEGPSSYAVTADLIAESDIKQSFTQEADQVQNTAIPSYVEDIIPILTNVTGFERHELGAHMDLRLDLAMRSSRFPVILNEIEKAFNVQVNFEDLINVTTVGDLALAVAKIRQLDLAKLEQNDNVNSCKSLKHSPVIRSVIRQIPLCLDNSHEPLAVQNCSHILPTLIVGNNCCAQMWHDFLTKTLSNEHVLWIKDAGQVNFDQSMTPACLIIAIDASQSSVDNELFAHVHLCQAFLSTTKAQMCIVHEQGTEHALNSTLFAALHGLMLNTAQEFTAVQFRVLRSEHGLSDIAMQGFLHKVLQANTNIPLGITITQSHISSVHLEPKPCDIGNLGLPIDKNHVIIVSGGGRGIIPKALQGIAPLGCTLILLGRSSNASNNVVETLSELGAKCHYYSCDITNKDAVQALIQDVHSRWGRIDGLIHAANITNNTLLNELKPSQLEQAFKTKYLGLQNLLIEAASYGLSFAVGIAPQNALIGQTSHANDGLVNKAMAAMLKEFCEKNSIAWRCIYLAPIIANLNSLKEQELQIDRISSDFIEYDELPMLFVRELLCGTEQSVLWHKKLPMLDNDIYDSQSIIPQRHTHHAFGPEYKHLFSTYFTNEAYQTFYAKRNFSAYADHALESQPTCSALVNSLMMLDTMYDATFAGFSWLSIYGADDLQFNYPLPCSNGVTRESALKVQVKSWQFQNDMPTMQCNAQLEVFDISQNGRRLQSKQNFASAKIYLGTRENNIVSLWTDTLQRQLITQDFQKDTLSRKKVAQLDYSGYAWPVECIVALQCTALSTYKDYYISSIGRLRHVPVCHSLKELELLWHLRDSEQGKVLDALVSDAHGVVILAVQDLHMLPNQ